MVMVFDGTSIRIIVIHYYVFPNEFSNDKVIKPSKLDFDLR